MTLPETEPPETARPPADGPVDRAVARIGSGLSWLFLVAAALTCVEVLMDWVFRAPTIWVHDTTIMLTSTCFLFGGAYALQRHDHIRITVVYDLLPARVQRFLDGVALALGLAYLLAIGWYAGIQALSSIRIVEMSGRAWDFPMPMVIRTAFFLGTALFALQAAVLLGRLVLRRRT